MKWKEARKQPAQLRKNLDSTSSKEISDPTETTSRIVKAKKETLQDEPLWQEGPYAGTHPDSRIYSHNLDFSSLPLLTERVFADRYADAESPLNLIPDDMVEPAPIAECLKMITNANSPTGDLIKANFSSAGIPAPHITAGDGVIDQPSEGFGPCTAVNHNA